MTSRKTIRIALPLLILALAGCGSLDLIKKRLPPPHRVDGGVMFQYEAPAATVVTLAGNWDGNWWGGTAAASARYDNSIGRMSDPDDDGIWSVVAPLPPGRYQYKFVVDNNTWVPDPNNPETASDGGFTNSLLVLK